MKINKKRRLENKTDYRKRLILLKGNRLRLVVRKTNKYVILQIIESRNAQDYITDSITTRDLLKMGWPEKSKGSLKSIPAAYLAGLILGKKIKNKVKDKVILDLGLIPNTKGSRVYSAVKGISDAGVLINCSKEVLPSEERIAGKFMKEDFSNTFKKIKEGLK
jgi:large subunit ribosomal protein L18